MQLGFSIMFLKASEIPGDYNDLTCWWKILMTEGLVDLVTTTIFAAASTIPLNSDAQLKFKLYL